MLNVLDEGSSLGTPEGSSGNAEVDCISVGSLPNDAEWRLITSEGFDTQEGVLILDGEEPERSIVDVLSLPGVDSLPTIVGSIEGLPNSSSIKALAKDELHENRVSTSTSSTGNNLKMETHQGTQTVTTPSSGNKSRLALFLVPTVALFLVPTIASVKLYGIVQELEVERGALQSSLQRVLGELADEKIFFADHIDYLEEEKTSLSNHISQLQEEIADLHLEVDRKNQEDALLWDDCRQAREEVVLLNNCWLSASANVKLGNCVNDAKEVVKNLSVSLFERLEQLGNTSMWIDPLAYYDDDETIVHVVDESVTTVMRKVDSLGKALWNATTFSAKEAYEMGRKADLDIFPSFFSKIEANSKSWLKNSIFNMFVSHEDEDNQQRKRSSSSRTKHHSANNLDDVVLGISDMLRAASKSMTAGEAFMAAAIDSAMNETSMNDLLDIATRVLQDASRYWPAEK